jgi:hypothetical protein
MTYEIKMVERVTFLNERNNPVDGYRVTFQMTDGTIDWIDLPKPQYNKANVAAAIEAAVKLHESVTTKSGKS